MVDYGDIAIPFILFNRQQIGIIVNAIRKVEVQVKRERDLLPYENAIDYISLLHKNITQGTFSTSYPPYSPRYAKWKVETMRMGSSFWILKGDLLRSLTVIKKRWGFVGGIPLNAMDSGGKSWHGTGDKGPRKSITMYAKTIEFGLGKQPARPVFEPTGEQFSKAGWLLNAKQSMDRIGRVWRK